jgi:hypothetical protein
MCGWGLTIIGAALSAGVDGCGGTSCTGRPCPDTGVEVAFSRALDSAKAYQLNVIADGSASSCLVTLQATTACANRAIWTSSVPVVTLTGQRLPLGGLAGVRVPGHPSGLTVSVLEDMQTLATAKFDSITYKDVEINGPGCGACRTATLSMNVP